MPFKKIHGDSKTSFYKIWCKIKERCSNGNCERYHRYGGRGITYDPKWNDYLGFKEDMYFKYLYALKKYRYKLNNKNPLSIERINNDGNYCFNNCIFIPLNKQCSNTSKNKWFIAINTKNNQRIKNNNQKRFAIKNNLNPSHLCACLKGNRATHNNWRFKYL